MKLRVAQHDDPRTAASDGGCRRDRPAVWCRGSDHDRVDAAIAGALTHLPLERMRIGCDVSAAEGRGQIGASAMWIQPEHDAAGRAQQLRRDLPDQPEPQHGDMGTEATAREPDRMQRDGPDGRERCILGGHASGYGRHEVARDQVHLGMCGVTTAGTCHEGAGRVESRAVLFHDPGGAVPERLGDGEPRAYRTLCLPQPVAPDLVDHLAHEVGPPRGLRGERHTRERGGRAFGPGADERHLGAYEHVAGARRGSRNVLDVRRAVAVTDHRLHDGMLSPFTDTASPLAFGSNLPVLAGAVARGKLSSAREASLRARHRRCAGAGPR